MSSPVASTMASSQISSQISMDNRLLPGFPHARSLSKGTTLDDVHSQTSDTSLGQANLPQYTSSDIALGDVAGVLRRLLSLGEVGVCLRLLESLEISALGPQPLGGKGSHMAPVFRHFLQSFVKQDRFDHSDPGNSFLDNWATTSSSGSREVSLSPGNRQRKVRANRLAANKFKTSPSGPLEGDELGAGEISLQNGSSDDNADRNTGAVPREPLIYTSNSTDNSRDDEQASPTVDQLIAAYQTERPTPSPHAAVCAQFTKQRSLNPEQRLHPAPPVRRSDRAHSQPLEFKVSVTPSQSPKPPTQLDCTPVLEKRSRTGQLDCRRAKRSDSRHHSGFDVKAITLIKSGSRHTELDQRPHPEFFEKRKQKMKGSHATPSPISAQSNTRDPSKYFSQPNSAWVECVSKIESSQSPSVSPVPVLTVCEPVVPPGCPEELVVEEPDLSQNACKPECDLSEQQVHEQSKEDELPRALSHPNSQESGTVSDSSDDSSRGADDDYDFFETEIEPDSPPPAMKQTKRLSFSGSVDNLRDASWFATPSHRLMIHPNSNIRLGWDCVSLCIILTESVTIPLVMGFNLFLPEAWFWTSTVFFACDIMLNFHTGYFNDGLLVMRQSMVVHDYLRRFFVIDFCSTMPWELLFSSGQDSAESSEATLLRLAKIGKLMRVLRLLRLVKLRHLLARIEDMFPSQMFSVTLSLIKVVSLFALLCHWSACIWAYIGNPVKVSHPTARLSPHRYEDCEPGGPCEAGLDGSPWLRRYGYDSFGIGTQYLAALHFAVGLVTANEMDIRPGYWGERVYSILLMIISLSVTSVVISQAVVILNKINQGRAEFRERMQFIKEFMRSRKVPIPLQVKVKRYLEYQFKSMRDKSSHMAFLEDLSPWIRLELIEHLNKDIITRHPFFQDLSSNLVKHFCARALTVLYAPGDVVVQKNHLASCIGFIVKGKLRIVRRTNPNNNNSILCAPSWIGDTSIFVDMVRKFTIISVTHSELLTITKEVVMEVIAEFPKFGATYETYKKMVEEGDFVGSGSQCQHCLQFGHNLADCPSLAKGLAGNLSLPVGLDASHQRLNVHAEKPGQSLVAGFFNKIQQKRKGSTPPIVQRRRSTGSVAPIQSPKFNPTKQRSGSKDAARPSSPDDRDGSPSPSPCQAQNYSPWQGPSSPCPPSPTENIPEEFLVDETTDQSLETGEQASGPGALRIQAV